MIAPALTGTAVAPATVERSADAVEANDRMLLEKARGAMERGDYPAARAALLRIRSPRFSADREARLRDVAAHLDGGR